MHMQGHMHMEVCMHMEVWSAAAERLEAGRWCRRRGMESGFRVRCLVVRRSGSSPGTPDIAVPSRFRKRKKPGRATPPGVVL